MSTHSDDVEGQGSPRNNPIHDGDPEVASPLASGIATEVEMKNLLRNNQALSGFLVNHNSGPIRSNYEVAIFKDGGYYSPLWIHEENSLKMETIKTQSERDSNYVHNGWSLSATTRHSPWSASRIDRESQATRYDSWVTKRAVLQCLRVKTLHEDLKPNPDFEDEVRAALTLPTKAKKFQAVCEALNRWGDVVPLSYDLGISLNLTELENNVNPELSWWGMNFRMPQSARLDTNGGTANVIHKGFGAWMEQVLLPQDMRIVRIVEVVPTLQLLDKAFQEELTDLHSTILSFDRSFDDDGTDPGRKTWSDINTAFKTVSSITVRCVGFIEGISIAYRDGSRSEHRGGSTGTEHVFDLDIDEHISAILAWVAVAVCRIQFITTKGRMSPHYGGQGGKPVLWVCPGSVLAGISGSSVKVGDLDAIGHIQAIWRHDTAADLCDHGQRYAEYIGGWHGTTFSDWPYSGRFNSAYISRVDVDFGDQVQGIQFTYTEKHNDRVSVVRAPHRSGRGGNQNHFQLDPEEFIVSVSGTHDDSVLVRLCFVTNKGRTSEVFGGNGGTSFLCQPQTNDGKSMRLCFVAGKCGSRVDGLLFVWMPV